MAHMHATEIGRELPPPVDVAPNAIAEISATLLRAQTFTGANGVGLTVRENGSLVCHASNGVGSPEFGAAIPMEGTFLGVCLATKRPQKCDDTDTDLRFENNCYSRVRPKSVLAVPVRTENDCIAVLAVYSNSANAFNNTHIAILRTMADSLARHVQGLPPLDARPAAPPAPVAVPEPVALQPKPQPVATMPKPQPVAPPRVTPPAPRPEPVEAAPAIAAPQLPPPPASQLTPTPVKKQEDELLVLASDPGPAPVADIPRAPITAPPRIFTAPSAYALPRPLPRPRRRHNLRVPLIAAAVLASTVVAAAGWRMTRHSAAPHPVPAVAVAPAAAPVVAAQAPTPDTPAPAPVAQVSAIVSAPVTHETAAAAASAEHPAEKTPVLEHAPAVPLKAVAPKPLPTHTAEVEAPALAMNIAPALPVVAAPVAVPVPAPALHHSEVVPAKVLQRVSPNYPSTALRMHITGKVTLSAVIRKDGSVGDVKMVSGSAFLRESAINAVKQWRYTPAMLDGSPVESSAEIVLNFTAPR